MKYERVTEEMDDLKEKVKIRRMILSAMFLAIAYVLPFFTGQIPQIGNMLCPMHIPVLLCGFICGGGFGFLVGILAPLLRSVILGMPILFPMAVCMAFELGTYGMVSGILYRKFPKNKLYVYLSLVTAMVLGRLIWGAAMYLCLGVNGGSFSLNVFWTGAVTNAIPGIIIQIILIPMIILAVQRWEYDDRNERYKSE